MARQNLDIIIGYLHQRSYTYLAIGMVSRNLAYNTNDYVIRSSVSTHELSDIGGGSMVVAPTGKVLLNMHNKVGFATVYIDPCDKYYKLAGFANPLAAHYAYIEKGCASWKYCLAGSAIAWHDDIMLYPRVCACSGFNTIAPENSIAAFGAAVTMDAQEIGFDLWFTKDGEVVSIHNSILGRVSNGNGNVWDYTPNELHEFDFRAKCAEQFRGM